MAPLVVLISLFIMPESPRVNLLSFDLNASLPSQWLVHHGHKEKAIAILAKYHANGDEDDELVSYEYNEICTAIQLEEENSKTSFLDFLKTPGNRRRLLVLITMATGTVRIVSSRKSNVLI